MGNSLTKFAVVLLAAIFSFVAVLAQSSTTVTGNVHNSLKDAVPAVSVTIKGSRSGTFTDDRGNFKLTTDRKPPFVLVFTSVGFESQEVSVNDGSAPVEIVFIPAATLGTEVVVAASRVPERILESPVSVERMGQSAIREVPQEPWQACR